jgi:hypothetical protein
MPSDLDFVTPEDKPALVALSTPELIDTAKTALDQLGYKVHIAENHGEFLHKFGQIPYQLVVMEETFNSQNINENESLNVLQRMPMNLRRHAVMVLFGFSLATFNPLQAFRYGVHAVVNPSEMFLFTQLIQKAAADNDVFLRTFRETLRELG